MNEAKPQKRKFLKTFFKERKQVGAVAPSSRFLVKKMCDSIDFKSAKVIIELGPGTGVFTREILKRASDHTKIFVFELNEDFYRILKNKFSDKRIILVNESAEHLEMTLKSHQVSEADAIISSLPLTVIPEPVKSNIVKASHQILKRDGIYVQYQYSLNAKKLIESIFGKLNLRFSLINLPPAFIYFAVKKD
ncbi:MAG: rRNA adenine N-6-methyltransferase family protein [Putridiphycobacter sp.]|nr:rRNA adenine N-6-methyltransferase family protein [Putridiphycobacter sp.]